MLEDDGDDGDSDDSRAGAIAVVWSSGGESGGEPLLVRMSLRLRSWWKGDVLLSRRERGGEAKRGMVRLRCCSQRWRTYSRPVTPAGEDVQRVHAGTQQRSNAAPGSYSNCVILTVLYKYYRTSNSALASFGLLAC
jgi:hypothetical protein